MKIDGIATSNLAQPQYGKSETVMQKSDGTENRTDNIKGKDEQFVEKAIFVQPGSKEQEERLKDAVEKANKTMETYGTELRFSVHKDSGEIMVKVINTKDNSVIREIPPERILDMVAHFKKMLGVMIDKFI